MAVTTKKKFGEILVEAGVISEIALRQALDRQLITGWRLGKVLEAMGVIAEKDIAVALSKQFGFRTAKDFAAHVFAAELLDLIPEKLVKKAQVFPLKREGSSLYLAMVNPLDIPVIDDVSRIARLHIIPVVTTASEIAAAIRRHYDERSVAIRGGVMVGQELATLLVIDAIPASRLKLVTFLQGAGFLVEHAGSEAEACALIRDHLPHLALVDSEYPDQLNPQNLLQDLGDIPLIAIGPNPVKEEVVLLNSGFIDFIHKPFHQERLLARINSALQLIYGEGKGSRKRLSAQLD
jgi:CheY-like chemotaxis protein